MATKSKKNGKKKKFEKFKDIYFKVNGPIGFVSSCITIIVVFTGESKIFKYVLCTIILVYFIVLCAYIVKSIFNTNKAKVELDKDYFSKTRNLAIRMHRYFHNLRNYISSISISEQKILKYQDVVDKCQNICDYLSEFYKALFDSYLDNNTISVCIKLIQTDSVFDVNYNNWKMETIARSASTEQERTNIDKKLVMISENSDFQVVLSEEFKDELFSFSDMRNIKEDFLKTYKMAYKNSRGDNFLDYYRSTIVVPIKIDGRFVSSELKKEAKELEKRYLVLGFLCIDSMKVFETEQERLIFSIGVEYAKSLGDSLYLFFEKILLCCMKNAKIEKDLDIQEKHFENNAYN
ncbi:hypothetical protein K040078D81_43570 [Blautia hominis]|uniref:Uncharacterized protein n=1 Tax=Blautia hominis TaxID=2025493 RepID=A0ABQ0BFJ1_9FIRM